ncbi:SRPBCC family protein [Acidimicrobiia bacterium EGI L10123]|uniref:SRPBCC family protein n=1 Tax=Salinilacustrithrix flava TaxID=2957203 RepID=UPI003D7C2ECC|nr:SRPBCC family protein [Acidimicrobiia bacterium EGI L10123]
MAINSVRSTLPPEAVFEHLLTPWEYPKWLLGASKMRDVDDHWPSVGSRFHHTVGFGPLKVDDTSEILECDPPRRLVLKVKATPIVQGIVTFTLVPTPQGGTVLTLQEEPAVRAGGLLRPALDPPTHVRNERSLKQLADLMKPGDGDTAS